MARKPLQPADITVHMIFKPNPSDAKQLMLQVLDIVLSGSGSK